MNEPCEHCGEQIGYYPLGCAGCGAPQCCPRCCDEENARRATSEPPPDPRDMEMEELRDLAARYAGEIAALRAENKRLREAGVGYSQQTVDALTKERDALRVKNAALRVAMSDAIVIGGRGDAADAVRLLRKALRGEEK
jgi:hypothetical protein